MEKTFEDYKKVFDNIIDICLTHNEQSLDLDKYYNNMELLQQLKEKLKDREMYLDMYVKIQLASLKDFSLYFDCNFCFGFKKYIDMDRIIDYCNNILICKFNKKLL
jgi:hypothetical protein